MLQRRQPFEIGRQLLLTLLAFGCSSPCPHYALAAPHPACSWMLFILASLCLCCSSPCLLLDALHPAHTMPWLLLTLIAFAKGFGHKLLLQHRQPSGKVAALEQDLGIVRMEAVQKLAAAGEESAEKLVLENPQAQQPQVCKGRAAQLASSQAQVDSLRAEHRRAALECK
eukprot:scaffold76305_cov20-Tisochrysis_lutea.AAC.1